MDTNCVRGSSVSTFGTGYRAHGLQGLHFNDATGYRRLISCRNLVPRHLGQDQPPAVGVGDARVSEAGSDERRQRHPQWVEIA